MIGTKDRKFLDRRLEIAESDMSDDEKRAALAALKQEMAEWESFRARSVWPLLASTLFFVVAGMILVLMNQYLLAIGTVLPLLIFTSYFVWKALP